MHQHRSTLSDQRCGLVLAGVQMFANFVDHVVDTAYTGSCIADPDQEVSFSSLLLQLGVQ
jgi:hypothetical protein